jgi:3-hydroxybutyryl-CoA dehydrogenase
VIRRVAVIGAGTMGHGIAAVSAMSGYDVVIADANDATLAQAMRRIEATFDKAVERGKLEPGKRGAALACVRAVASASDAAADADLVIEAIPERLELKQQLFGELASSTRPDAIFASNTSSLSISEIASAVASPERVIGLHFFNPVPAMRLVEIVRGRATSDAVVADARAFAESLGKTSIVVKDSPGFATSRLGVVLGLEAVRMLEQGVASAEDIDRAMELGYNHPVGPLRLGDMVGLDVRLAIADHLHATLGGDTYRAPELLRRMVAEGKLGKKTGQGFYTW